MKLAVIGGGKMAHAMVFGILKTKLIEAKNIYVSDKFEAGLADFAEAGIHTTTDNAIAANAADTILVAVKPDIYPLVLTKLSKLDGAEKTLLLHRASP